MDTGGQFSMRNVPASRSSAVTLGNTSSSGPPDFQHLAPILYKDILVTEKFGVRIVFEVH
jgi:hypothetical protein